MTNVDPNEIAKFESIAERWWDPTGEFKPLHDLNPLRLNYINERTPLAEKKVLDVGCGGGILSEGLARRGADVTGIDLGAANLDVARAHAVQSGLNIRYETVAVEALAAAEPEQFDIITCMEMLEHVPAPDQIVAACAKLLKPGGHLFLSTINRNPKSYLVAIVGAEHVLRVVPKGTHEYMKLIRPSELCSWLRRAGLHTRDITGMTVNPLTLSFKLGRDTDVNYFVYAQKP